MASVQVVISGRVQGVWYRAWTQKKATGFGLRGWVRNRADGSVEAVFCGAAAQVAAMIAACHDGPPLARVDAVVSEPCSEPDESGFVTRPTA